jgi:hypothetical protein
MDCPPGRDADSHDQQRSERHRKIPLHFLILAPQTGEVSALKLSARQP